MINEYIVKYYMGNKKNAVYQLHICSHDEDEARKIVIAQAWNRHGGHAKVNVLDVRDENKTSFVMPNFAAPIPQQPIIKKPVNWNGCINMSISAICIYIVIAGIACAAPCWLVHILYKLLINWAGG